MPICPKCRGENAELGAKCPRDEFYYIHEDALEDAQQDSWIGSLAAEKYVIVGLISEGGMGAVYRAIQLPVQREIAFKVLRTDLQDSTQGKERFAREARAISRLSHPNIITMHDFGVDDHGHPFMAMEYAPGQSLADWMMTPGLEFERICHVFRQILAAMSEAHDQGVIHRDLKPENLIVTRAGNDSDYVKLLDFGIARMVQDTATRGLTRDGEVFGTPHYMSPEQAQGQKNIGPPADVYALGIMFYELLSGECPFDAPTPLSILYMQIHDDLPKLRPKNRMEVPDGLGDLIAHATAKDPAKRFENAGAMLNAMDHAMGNVSGLYEMPGGVSDAVTPPASSGPEKQTDLDLPSAYETEVDAAAVANKSSALSNDVAVNDPSLETDLDLHRSERERKRKFGLIAIVFLLLLGGSIVFMFVSESDDSTGSEDNGRAQVAEKANAKMEEPSASPSPSAPPSDPKPAQPAAGEENPRAQKPVEKKLVADELAGDSLGGSESSRPSNPSKSSKPSEPSTPSAPDRPVANEGVKPTKTKKPSTPAERAQGSTKSDDKEDAEPKKFRPVKFGAPAEKPDESPKKFQPK